MPGERTVIGSLSGYLFLLRRSLVAKKHLCPRSQARDRKLREDQRISRDQSPRAAAMVLLFKIDAGLRREGPLKDPILGRQDPEAELSFALAEGWRAIFGSGTKVQNKTGGSRCSPARSPRTANRLADRRAVGGRARTGGVCANHSALIGEKHPLACRSGRYGRGRNRLAIDAAGRIRGSGGIDEGVAALGTVRKDGIDEPCRG